LTHEDTMEDGYVLTHMAHLSTPWHLRQNSHLPDAMRSLRLRLLECMGTATTFSAVRRKVIIKS
jgi:hypothetical protein